MKIFAKTLLISGLFFIWTASVSAEATTFFIDSRHDRFAREEISAVLLEKSDRGVFYVEQTWWNGLDDGGREKGRDFLKILSYELDKNIFPILSSTYHWDGDTSVPGQEIYILIHPMRGGAGGYFRPIDQQDRLQNPLSNGRQMVYLNSDHLHDYYIRSILAHELTHLITYHRKEKRHQVTEEVWLNEARAEYAPTLMNYDRIYEGSNLQRRAKTFLEHPDNSLVGWEGRIGDYGALNLFVQYLVDHYGVEILVDSLHSPKIGIASINEALIKNGYQEDFARIYTNWTIAVLVNNCSLGQHYCYRSKNLEDIRIIPRTNFLPLNRGTTLAATDQLQNWGAQWLRFIGGDGDLRIRFFGQSETLFRVPYVLIDRQGKTRIGFFNLNEYQNGEIEIINFGSTYYSLTILPSIQSKQSGFNGTESYAPFKWEAITTPHDRSKQLIAQLQEQIRRLERQVDYLRSQIALVLARRQNIPLASFERDLSFGLTNSDEVKALQLFLAIQDPEIYPAGLVTGNFYRLTREAVIRFQEKHADDVLKPANLSRGTGYVGLRTRRKINEMLSLKPSA